MPNGRGRVDTDLLHCGGSAELRDVCDLGISNEPVPLRRQGREGSHQLLGLLVTLCPHLE